MICSCVTAVTKRKTKDKMKRIVLQSKDRCKQRKTKVPPTPQELSRCKQKKKKKMKKEKDPVAKKNRLWYTKRKEKYQKKNVKGVYIW